MAFKFLAVAAAAVLSATVAQATDLPNKKTPPSGPVAKASAYDWTGAYVGGSLGAARTTDDGSLSGDPENRAIPGIYAGYNYRINSNVVIGIEADIDYMGLNQDDGAASGTIPGGTSACYKVNKNDPTKVIVKGAGAGNCKGNGFTFGPVPGSVPVTISSSATSFSLRDIDTLRVRAGYLITPSTLMFATAGLGLAHASLESVVDSVPESTSGYHAGFVVGGGLEHSYSKLWSVKLDYLYYDLGKIETTTDSVALKGHMIRVGAAYHF